MKLFKVSKTFEIVTPESASEGMPESDGFYFEDRDYGLKDVLDAVNDLGAVHVQVHGDHMTVYGDDPDEDMYDGSETYDALHISGSKRTISRLAKLLKAS